MRYQPDDPRYDNPAAAMEHADRFGGGRALVILGGYSAQNWRDVREEVKPDVVIIANGVNALVQNADYWICAENMTRAHRMAQMGSAPDKAFVEMFHREAGAKYKLVSHRSIDRVRDKSNCIVIRRQGYETDEIARWFHFRDYGLGLLAGWLLKHKDAGAEVHVGTVGAQCLHWAGILGCNEVHTIGYDLMFRDEARHHAYEYPIYQADKFRSDSFRTEYEGVPTQYTWLESAAWLKSIEPIFERDSLVWRDHSNGLLSAMGLKCAL